MCFQKAGHGNVWTLHFSPIFFQIAFRANNLAPATKVLQTMSYPGISFDVLIKI